MSTLMGRIDGLMKVIGDEKEFTSVRINAADELLMWAGAALTRDVLSAQLRRRFTLHAGCLADRATGECRCDEAVRLIRLYRRGEVYRLDAMEVRFTDGDPL